MYNKERELNYQIIRLMNSGLNLYEVNFLRRIIFGYARGRSMSEADYKTMNEVIDKLERFSGLLETRKQRKQKVIQRYSRKRGQDRITNFLTNGLGTNLNLPVSLARPPELRRKVMKQRAESRPGSSIGKIGKTKVIGFNKLNKDIDQMAKALNEMIRAFESIGQRKGAKTIAKASINNFVSQLRTSVNMKK
jgi:hypothetical protein